MTSWMKGNFIIVIFVVMMTSSWAKPASPKTMRALDDSELSKVTDHEHSDKTSTHTHEPQGDKKDAQLSIAKENDFQKMKIIQTAQPKLFSR